MKNISKIRRLIIIVVLVLCTTVGLVFTAGTVLDKNKTVFADSGFVLLTDANAEFEKINFNKSEEYKVSSADEITFNDIQNIQSAVPTDSFFHFDADYISALQNGVFMNLDEVGNDFITYYQLDSGMIVNTANKIQVTANNNTYTFDRIIWKLNDNRYIILGENLKVSFGEDDVRECGDFVELHYLDRGVCQIITKDNVWQTASSTCYIESGKDVQIYPILERMYNTETDRESFMNSLVVDADDNMHLRNEQEKNVNNIIPHFNVVTEDGTTGEDGKSGEIGDNGKNGIIGVNGVIGNDGETGNDGTSGFNGNNGSLGSEGKEGELGVKGDKGDKGDKGEDGITGNKGATGAMGTSADSDASSRQEIPTMTVNTWDVTYSTIKGSVTLNDTNGVVINSSTDKDKYTTEDYIHAYVMETNGSERIPIVQVTTDTTGKDHTSSTFEFTENEATNFTLEDGYELKPDTAYVLVFTGKYEMNNQVITKDFVYRTFYTDSIGVYMSKNMSTTNSIYIDAVKNDYSTSDSAYIFLLTKEENESITEATCENIISHNLDTLHYAKADFTKGSTITLDFGTKGYTLNPDTEYVARLYINYKENGVNKAKLSEQELNVETLKRIPTITSRPTVASNRQNKSFEIYSATVEDLDNAITKYIYEVYDNEASSGSSSLLKVIEVNPSDLKEFGYTTLYIDDETINFNHVYYVKEYIEYFDNEKTVVVETNSTGQTLNSSTFSMAGSQLPSVTFRYLEDEYGVKIGRQYDRIRGWIVINLNGSSIQFDAQRPIIVSMVSEGIFSKTLTFSSADNNIVDVQDNYLSIYIDERGLYRDTVYRLSIDAYVDCDEDGNGNVTMEYLYRNVGNIVISTAQMPRLKAIWSDPVTTGLGKVSKRLTLAAVNNSDTDYVLNTIAYTNIALYSGSSSANIKLKTKDFSDENPDDYGSSISAGLFAGIDLSNRNLGLPDNEVTSESYSMVVTEVSDYTKTSPNSGLAAGYYNIFEVVNNDSSLIGVEAQPPALPVQGQEDSCITARDITVENAASFGISTAAYTDVDENAIIGYALSSNYDNYGKLARKVTYYGFEANTLDYYYKTLHDESFDSELYQKALFNVTLDVPTTTNVIPKLIVLFGDNPLGGAKNFDTDGSPYYNPTTGYYYFYAGSPRGTTINSKSTLASGMDRGYIYVFADKVKYTSSSISTSTDLKTYPNDHPEYASWNDAYERMLVLRSSYKFAPKTLPTFQSYPLLTDKDRLVLYYRYVDSDNLVAYEGAGNTNTAKLTINGAASNVTVAQACEALDDVGANACSWNVADLSGVQGFALEDDYVATIGVEGGEYVINYTMTDYGIDDYDASIIVYRTPWYNNKNKILSALPENATLIVDDYNYINKNYIKVTLQLNGDVSKDKLIGAMLTFAPKVSGTGKDPIDIMCQFEESQANTFTATIPLSKLSNLKGLDLSVSGKILYDTEEFGWIDIEVQNEDSSNKDITKNIASLTSILQEKKGSDTYLSTSEYKYKDNLYFYSFMSQYYGIQTTTATTFINYYAKMITDENIGTREDAPINSMFKIVRSNYIQDGVKYYRYVAKHFATPSATWYYTYRFSNFGLERQNNGDTFGYTTIPKIIGAINIVPHNITTLADNNTKTVKISSIVPTATLPSINVDTQSATVGQIQISGADQITPNSDTNRYVTSKLYVYVDEFKTYDDDGKVTSTTKVDDYVYLPVKQVTGSDNKKYLVPINKNRVEVGDDGVKYENVTVTLNKDINDNYYFELDDSSVTPVEITTKVSSIDDTTKVGRTNGIHLYGLDPDTQYELEYYVNVEDLDGSTKQVAIINSNTSNSESLVSRFSTDDKVYIYNFKVTYSDTGNYTSKLFNVSLSLSQVTNVKVKYSIYDNENNLIMSHNEMFNRGIITSDDSSYSSQISKSLTFNQNNNTLTPGTTYVLQAEVFNPGEELISDPVRYEFALPLKYYPNGNISIVPRTVTIDSGSDQIVKYGFDFRFTALSDDEHYVMGAEKGDYGVRIYDASGNLIKDYDNTGAHVDNGILVTYIENGDSKTITLKEIYDTVFQSNEPSPTYTISGLEAGTNYKFVVYAAVDQNYNGKNDNMESVSLNHKFDAYSGYSYGTLVNALDPVSDANLYRALFDGTSDDSKELRSMYALVERTKATPDASGLSIGNVTSRVDPYNSSQIQLTYFATSGYEKIDELRISIVHKDGSPSLSARDGVIDNKAIVQSYYDVDTANEILTMTIPYTVFSATKKGVYDVIVYHYIDDVLVYTYEGSLVKN